MNINMEYMLALDAERVPQWELCDVLEYKGKSAPHSITSATITRMSITIDIRTVTSVVLTLTRTNAA